MAGVSEQKRNPMSRLPVTYESTAETISTRFEETYGTHPSIFRAPGRVNLIGEHTDYNDGFVMPAAIGFYTWVAMSPRSDQVIHARSEEFNEALELSLQDLSGPPRHHWSDFVRGVAAVLQTQGHEPSAVNLIIEGQVPMGAGLSSSASLEVAIILALLGEARDEVSQFELVKMCQKAEHEYVGTRCGIMDQFIAVFGQEGHALMLDCRTLESEALRIPEGARLVICNSMVRHDLAAAGEYNRRRADCETGVGILRKSLPQVRALRDVTLADLEAHRTELPEVVYRRCRHVISENQRVLDAASALRSGDLDDFGRLMRESHHSMRDDYEISVSELDLLVEIASECEGVYGSRMTGGGFGGCTISLVQSESVEEFQSTITHKYKNATGISAPIYVCSAAQGAGEWSS
jgi:galactokinase